VSETEHDEPEVTQTQSAPQGPGNGIGGLAQSIGARNLWIIILTMPAVFLVAVAAIIAIFGKPKGAEDAEPVAAIEEDVVAEAVEDLPDTIAVPMQAAPGAIALDGDRLAVRLDGPDGVVIVIYDIAKGEEIMRVPLAPAAE